jgi:hypothetical protein
MSTAEVILAILIGTWALVVCVAVVWAAVIRTRITRALMAQGWTLTGVTFLGGPTLAPPRVPNLGTTMPNLGRRGVP